jgi:hypothetical protein
MHEAILSLPHTSYLGKETTLSYLFILLLSDDNLDISL